MDSDKIEISKSHRPSDLSSMLGGMFKGINLKMVLLLFLSYILLHNDVFISRVLSKVDGSVGELGTCPTSKGTIILGTLLVLMYIGIDALTKFDLI